MDPTAPSNISPSASSQGSLETPSQAQKSTPDHHHQSLSDLYRNQFQTDAEEQSHWEDVCRAYRQYANFSLKQWGLNHVHRLASLPPSQAAVLPEYLQVNTEAFRERQNRFKEAAIRNQFCLDCILRHAGQPHSQEIHDTQFANDEQMSKVSSVLKSLTRDWTADGQAERDMAYLPILESLQTFVPLNADAPPPRICVPGAGVGRLACESRFPSTLRH
jgi:carnosine N-methyltransferase